MSRTHCLLGLYRPINHFPHVEQSNPAADVAVRGGLAKYKRYPNGLFGLTQLEFTPIKLSGRVRGMSLTKSTL